MQLHARPSASQAMNQPCAHGSAQHAGRPMVRAATADCKGIGKSTLARTVVCRAQDSNDSGPWRDIDEEWRSFQKRVRSQVETKEPSIRVGPIRPLPPRNSADQLRQQERVLLDLWTSEDALKWGGLAMLAGLMVVLVVSGPPSGMDDGRCTLPWC